MSISSIARHIPHPMHELPPQARRILTGLGRAIAQACGVISRDDHCSPIEPAYQETALIAVRLADPATCAEEVMLQLRRALCFTMHDCAFDQLLIEEREHIALLALTAWESMRDTLAGKAAALPDWERQCLTFSGPYDPALLIKAPTGTVQ